MSKILVWKHALAEPQQLQTEFVEKLRLDAEPLYVCPPEQAEWKKNELPWYVPTAPSRRWCSLYPMLKLGAGESELYYEATKQQKEPHLSVAECCTEYYVQAIAAHDIEYAIVWNGWQVVPRALVAALYHLGKRWVFAERGLLPGSLCVDPNGVLAASSLTPTYWEHLVEDGLSHDDRVSTMEVLHKLTERNTTMWQSGSEAKTHELINSLDPRKPTVLVIGQLDWDSNVLQRSPIYPTNKSILDAVEEYAAVANVLYKPHPKHPEPMLARYPIIDASGTDTQLLIRSADVIVLRTSTVGIEALLWGRPVVVLGDAIYGGRGFTTDVHQRGTLTEMIRRVADSYRSGSYWTSVNQARRMTFFRWLLFEHLFFGQEFEPLPAMSAGMVGLIRRCLTR